MKGGRAIDRHDRSRPSHQAHRKLRRVMPPAHPGRNRALAAISRTFGRGLATSNTQSSEFTVTLARSLPPRIRARNVEMQRQKQFLSLLPPPQVQVKKDMTESAGTANSREGGNGYSAKQSTSWLEPGWGNLKLQSSLMANQFAQQDRAVSWSYHGAVDSGDDSTERMRSSGRKDNSPPTPDGAGHSLSASRHVRSAQSSRRHGEGTPRSSVTRSHDPMFHIGRRICYELGGLCAFEKELSMAILCEYFENFWLRLLA